MSERDALLRTLAEAWGISWFNYQLAALDGERYTDSASLRACLFFATGKGKTYTALALMAQAGMDQVLVIAPPRTHGQWEGHGLTAGIKVRCMSHAMYRMKGTKFSRLQPVIVDEFHMLGGQSGTGWDKLRTQSRHMQAPLVILSATPNYNDHERVYCVEHVLDPLATKGGYIAWLYQRCETEQNPFGQAPIVHGFLDGRPAKEHLAALPHVYYVEDPHEDFPIGDIVLPTSVPDELEEYGINRRSERIVASRMEYESASRLHQLVAPNGMLDAAVYEQLSQLVGQSARPALVFCARSTIATAAYQAALAHGANPGLVIGSQPAKANERAIAAFKAGQLDVLFGTATMATGVDGIDKVCDLLILLDDTDDGALRRQVIGRILPRGLDTDVSQKVVARFVLGA